MAHQAQAQARTEERERGRGQSRRGEGGRKARKRLEERRLGGG